jgi:phi LC3 family holin
MKINWKIRWKNPNFIIQILLAVIVPILMYFGLTPQSITTWPLLFSVLFDAVLNPYVVFTIALSVYNAVNDPTTPGISDSNRALKYTKLNKDWG